MSAILEVNDLVTQFDTAEGTVYAVNGVSFYLNEGETLGVVGESGCGKSVTMMSILRLLPAPPAKILQGTAFYRGLDLLKISDHDIEHNIRGKEIGMVFQDPMTSLNPVLSIGFQIMESLKCHLSLDENLARAKTIDILTKVGIPDAEKRLNAFPHQFSGGMRQRAMIAMALACNPSLLIADEPTTALDVTIQAQIVELMIALREQVKLTLIWITHDLGVVAGLAERVMVMYAGYVVEEANVDDLYDDPRHPYTLALLAALPRVDRHRTHRLKSIPGAPPNLLVKPHGCPFAPRCEMAFERCYVENPSLISLSASHRVACWIDTTTGKSR